MIVKMLSLSVVALCFANASDWHGQWERAGSNWKERWTNSLNSIDSLSDHEKFEILGGGVRIGRSIESPDQKEIFLRAQATLLSIPGHAEYYRVQINEAREILENAREHENSSMVAYQRGKWEKAKEGFTVMSYLPSIETVRVLGDFLSDERGKIVLSQGYSRDEEMLALIKRPHCYSAMLALQKLPIVEKPCKPMGTYYMPDELEPALKPWQKWYEEIKSGRRTFRFEGDPTEYDLGGPAPKEKLTRIEMDRKRTEERVSGQHRTAADPTLRNAPPRPNENEAGSKTSSLFKWAGISGALVLVVAAILNFRRARNLR